MADPICAVPSVRIPEDTNNIILSLTIIPLGPCPGTSVSSILLRPLSERSSCKPQFNTWKEPDLVNMFPQETPLNNLMSRLETMINNGNPRLEVIPDLCILMRALRELNQIPGIAAVKDSIANFVLYSLAHRGDQNPNLNTILSGPPSETKHIIAGHLTDIWRGLGLIPVTPYTQNNIRVISRQDLVGSYVGHTEQKTQRLLETTTHPVVMIEEAYSLNNGDHDMFGHEALDALNRYLSEHREPTIIMDFLPETFPGLRRRFNWQFNIERTAEEIAEDEAFNMGETTNDMNEDEVFNIDRMTRETDEDEDLGFNLFD